ncbi:MAG: hypothetical protein AAGH41_02140 [Pseudomonadota bacterium]
MTWLLRAAHVLVWVAIVLAPVALATTWVDLSERAERFGQCYEYEFIGWFCERGSVFTWPRLGLEAAIDRGAAVVALFWLLLSPAVIGVAALLRSLSTQRQ